VNKRLSFYMAAILLSSSASNVLAERIQWKVEDGGNGHYYEGFEVAVTWSEANRLAKALGGHLATITSDAENRWVFDNVGQFYYWLGGTDALDEGNWTWVTGEEWVYERWGSTQPDNAQGKEHFLHYWRKPYDYGWNDHLGTFQGNGFIVEYTDSKVPASEGDFTQADIDAAKDAGRQACIDDPSSCGISSGLPATLSYDFKLHIPLLHYSPLADSDTMMSLSVDMGMTNAGQLLFRVTGYEEIE